MGHTPTLELCCKIARQVADGTRYKSRTDNYARVYQAALKAAQLSLEQGVVRELVEALTATTHEVEATIRCVTSEQTRDEMQVIADRANAVLAKIGAK